MEICLSIQLAILAMATGGLWADVLTGMIAGLYWHKNCRHSMQRWSAFMFHGSGLAIWQQKDLSEMGNDFAGDIPVLYSGSNLKGIDLKWHGAWDGKFSRPCLIT